MYIIAFVIKDRYQFSFGVCRCDREQLSQIQSIAYRYSKGMSDPIVYNTFNKYIKGQHNPSDRWHIFAVNRFVQLSVAKNVWNLRHISVAYRRTCGVIFNNGNSWNVMFDHVCYCRPCFTIKLSVFGPGNACMGHWTGSSLDQIMACLLPGVKPLLEPMTTYTRLQSQEQISMKFPFTYYIFHFSLKKHHRHRESFCLASKC